MRKEEFLKEHQDLFQKSVSRSDFPPDFVFGVATSAYQIEGGANEGGRGPSIWDAFTRRKGAIIDGSNGDVAVDHYHQYKEDIELIAKFGFGAYRFSISWSRIFPDGMGTKINDDGIKFYNSIIDSLLAKGIEPYVTLYHWDLPLHLEELMGGWLNKEIVKYFAVYADTCFANFGDRVKNWITINEPLQTAINGFDIGIFAPGRHEHSSVEPYLAAHHQILAHAAAVSIYRSKYQDLQGGQIGLVLDCEWAEAYSNKIEDKVAAARRLDFQLEWYLCPIYNEDYPEIMRKTLGDQLPKFSEEDKKLLRNSKPDFLGINHYTSRFICHVTDNTGGTYYYKAQAMKRIAEWEGGEPIGEKAASEWLYVCPWGLQKLLTYIAQRYNNIPIYVTENGMDDEDTDSPLHEMLDDKLRVRYFNGYLSAVAHAIKNGANVKGYFAWSLLDNFEWANGYTKRFGLIYVDYKNGLSRHPKSSAYWFRRFLKGGEEKNSKED